MPKINEIFDAPKEMAEAVQSGDADAMTAAFQRFMEQTTQRILADAEAAHLVKNDADAMAQRGYRQLTSKEQAFYQKIIDARNNKQQFIDIFTGNGEEIMPESRDIEAKGVEFSYDRKKVIDGISLSIPERTTTAIVGPSGGGKTTLVNLLARFWDADAGSVTLGGRDVRDYDMDSLMQNFSFVFQNVYLFRDTIANNIRFGRPDAPMEDVIAAAKKACCHDFIMALPEGYDTVIGEGGANLSGGERQRISIARAMMKDAPVIFLDEATANVDPENENELTRAIGALTREKTVIMIAHRLKTVEHADQILVVDHGKIVQRGTHEQLMAEEGIYKTFVGERREAASWKVKK